MSLWEIPAIVLTLLMWLQAPPSSLADASRREALRRQSTPAAVRSLTNQDVEGLPRRPLPSPPPAMSETTTPPAPPSPSGKEPEVHDEAWWRARVNDARMALERDQLLAEALQSRINGLSADWSARDDPAQRQQLFEARQRTLDELERMKEQVAADRKAIDGIAEEARRQNVPAGWIR